LYSQGRFPEAEKVLTEVLDLERQVLGPENRNTLVTATNLAYVLMKEGKLPESEKLYREALEIQRRTIGSDAPETLTTMSYLGMIANAGGHYAEAEKLQREALDTQQRVLGPQHSDTLTSMMFLARTIAKEGRYAEAEKLDREALSVLSARSVRRRSSRCMRPTNSQKFLNMKASTPKRRKWSGRPWMSNGAYLDQGTPKQQAPLNRSR